MSNEKKTYLLCYLRTGGGHFAPARALAQYFTSSHPEIEPVLIDGLENSLGYARYIIEDGYRILQAKAKWFYEFLYATNKFPPIGLFNVFMATLHLKNEMKKAVETHRPDKIIIFHFFLIKPVYQVLRSLNIHIPVVTVITDPFTAHPLWFKQKGQNFVLFSERLKQACLRKKEDPEKLHVFPFIVNEKFSRSLSADEIQFHQSQFGFDPKKKTVLIIGGGDGIRRGEKIVEKLLQANLDVNLVLVAGRNKKLYNDAVKLQQSFPFLKVFGFVSFVYELLNVSDIVITKCGASTIMEILMLKKIPVIIDYLWEQELGNMEFVRDNRLGIFEPNINRLPAIIKNLIEDDNLRQTVQQNIERMNIRSGIKETAEFLVTV
ncbi:MAG: hypothetical protein H3C35_04230 [Bacteroidetes bacterium]|nr:hypothetical protein [Bacteroidota bacterium]